MQTSDAESLSRGPQTDVEAAIIPSSQPYCATRFRGGDMQLMFAADCYLLLSVQHVQVYRSAQARQPDELDKSQG